MSIPYDIFVNWDRRLAREGPLFRELFDKFSVNRIIDAGCGSGRHSRLFIEWKKTVWGFDISKEMLDAARKNFQEKGIHISMKNELLMQNDLRKFSKDAPFRADCVVCVGNVLVNLPDITAVQETLGEFSRVLEPGGIVFIQVLNNFRFPNRGIHFVTPKYADTPEGKLMFIRCLEFNENRTTHIVMNFLVLFRKNDSDQWVVQVNSRFPHLVLTPEILTEPISQNGFEIVHIWGDYNKSPFEINSSIDLILVLRKKI